MFATAFDSAGVQVEWQVYNMLENEQPKHLNEVDGYITTGARAGVYDELPWYANLVALIRAIESAKIPLVGICFGHQAIADALGGKAENSDKGWGIGIRSYHATESPAWMNPVLNEFSVPVCHQDQVVELPANSRLIASSDHCQHFMAEFSNTSLGVQGHPEFDVEYLETLIKLREEVLPADTSVVAQKSLGNAHNNATIIRWISNFLRVGQN